MPAPTAPKAAAAAEQGPQPDAQLCLSTQAACAQLSPEIDCLSLGAIVPLLPSDSAPSSPAASEGAPRGVGALAALGDRPDGGYRPGATVKAR